MKPTSQPQRPGGVVGNVVTMDSTVRIVAAALKIDGLVVTLPPPARHADLIHPYFKLTGRQVGPGHQGFITSEGLFVDREKAARIAVLAGQIERPTYGAELYSEDLW